MSRSVYSVIAVTIFLFSVVAPALGSGVLYPYGSAVGDTLLVPTDDGYSGVISLSVPFHFFGTARTSLYVDNNGILSFNNPVSSYTPTPFPAANNPVIAPYWGDVDTRTRGTAGAGNEDVWYREISYPHGGAPPSDQLLLDSATTEALDGFPAAIGFVADSLFIVTWDQVGYYGTHYNKLNTFQAVLVYSSTSTAAFAIFNYGQLQWTTGDASGGSNGVGGVPAQTGFDAGDLTHYYTDPRSQTAAIVNLVSSSNVGITGSFVYQVNEDTIVASASGDPTLVGLQGQVYQVHGLPDAIFNLISTPTFQLNSLFVFIPSGTCNYNNTQCWTHPGTYLGQLGFNFDGQHRLQIISGQHSRGLQVILDDQTILPSDSAMQLKITNGSVSVHVQDYDRVAITTNLFQIVVVNSDNFVNIDVGLTDSDLLRLGSVPAVVQDHFDTSGLYPNIPVHGLIAQSWKNIVYSERRVYEGQVEDYMLASKDIFGNDFHFNKFHTTQ